MKKTYKKISPFIYNNLIHLFFILYFFLLFPACKINENKGQEGEQLAKTYCSSCHLFPDPSLLDTNTWEKDVLPAMGKQLGIKYFDGEPYEDIQVTYDSANKVSAKRPTISSDDWKKILNYYKSAASGKMHSQDRPPVQQFTNLFVTKTLLLPEGGFPSTSYIKIDPGNHWIYAADAFDSSINIYNGFLQRIAKYNIHGVLIDMQFSESLQQRGERSGILTEIGIMNPNDLKTGTADTFHITKRASFSYLKRILDSMPRPVQTTSVDLDKDGKEDYLICGFGNTKGALYWMKNEGGGKFEQRMIRPLPGAIKVYIDDYNGDGLPDIMALMAQAWEGIYLFINKGNGMFDTKEALQFPAVYGSSYFELDDFNNDGFKDILYTCGDNADFSAHTLKNFHGVYIFLNDGKNNFAQKYFFPIHGCYKAVARDFDNDGDLDIAAISYFPDSKNQPQEAFVYLENKSTIASHHEIFQFAPYTIKDFNKGKWLTMDAGDVDGDGDDDIVLGNLIPPIKSLQMQSLSGKKQRPAFLLLENKRRQ